MDKKLMLGVEGFSVVDDVSDNQLALVEVYVCHDGNNAHNMPIDLSVIKKAKSTLKNKFLVAGYDDGDFEGHEPDEQIVGFFPESSKMSFKKKDGKTYLVAQAIMSKVYAQWAYNIFVEENNRAVSMEILVTDAEEDSEGFTHITEFVFSGVTLLGKTHIPACEGADASIIKFSVENASEIYSKCFSSSSKIKRDFVNAMKLADNSRKEGTETMEDKDKKVKAAKEAEEMKDKSSKMEDESKMEDDKVDMSKTEEEVVVDMSDKDKEDDDDVVIMEDSKHKDEDEDEDEKDEEEDNDDDKLPENKDKDDTTFEEGSITIDNSKDSAIESGSWSNPGKKLYGPILEASNEKALVKEAYLVVNAGYEDAPSENLKYPHHNVEGDKLVVNKAGVEAAFQRASQEGIVKGKVKAHLLRHYRELGLSTENFENLEFESLTVEQKYEVFRAAMRDERFSGYLESFDDDYIYIYHWDDSAIYRHSYTLDGTSVTISDEGERVMRGGYVPFADVDKKDTKSKKEDDKKSTDKEDDKEKVKNLEAKVCELEEKVEEYEEEKKTLKLESILATVREDLTTEQISELREKAEKYSIEELSTFENEVKAIAFESVKNKTGKYTFNRITVYDSGVQTADSKYSW